MKVDYDAGDHVECINDDRRDDTRGRCPVTMGAVYVCAGFEDVYPVMECGCCGGVHETYTVMEGVICDCGLGPPGHLILICPTRFRLIYKPKESLIEGLKADIDTKAPPVVVKTPKQTEPA